MPTSTFELRRLATGWRDLRHAAHVLRTQRGFTAAVTLTLALGIGVNTSIFSLFNAVLLRPLPVPAADQLAQIGRRTAPGRLGGLSFQAFQHLREHLQSATGVAASVSVTETILLGADQSTQQDAAPTEDFVAADLVSGEYFAMLGIRTIAGRLPDRPHDSSNDRAPAAVISDHYWNVRFGRSPSAIGRTLTARGRTFTIVGVAPPYFHGVRLGQHPDVFLPLELLLTAEQRDEPSNHILDVMARLRPDVSVEQADAEVASLWATFIAEHLPAGTGAPSAPGTNRAGLVPAPGGINPLRTDLEQPLTILMGSVLLILVLACVNLSGLLLARATTRGKEVAVRLALGARRQDVARLFLAEGLILIAAGSALGLAIARPLTTQLLALFMNGRDVELPVAFDWRVFAFTLVTAAACGLIAVLVPALQGARVPLNGALRRVPAQGRGHLAHLLVVAQFTISMVLIVGAALFVGTLAKLYGVDRGFNSTGVAIVNVRSIQPYPPERAAVVLSTLVSQLADISGAQSATAAQILPVGGNSWNRTVLLEGDPVGADAPTTFNAIAPGYFATLGVPFLAGRDFTDRDTRGTPPVAIVNDAFAMHFFHTRDVIGRRVTSVGVTYDIVGLTSNSLYESLRDAAPSTMFVAGYQREPEQPTRYSYLVRARSGNTAAVLAGIAQAVRTVDPALRVRAVTNYGTLIDRSLPSERILGALGAVFGLLALIIAGIGLFALLAFQVNRRRNELGVRLALGATSRHLIWLVLREVVGLVGIGAVLGAGASALASNVVRSSVFNVSPTNPSVIAAAVALLATSACIAAWLPTWRAVHTDPLTVLKAD